MYNYPPTDAIIFSFINDIREILEGNNSNQSDNGEELLKGDNYTEHYYLSCRRKTKFAIVKAKISLVQLFPTDAINFIFINDIQKEILSYNNSTSS